jgi:predicted MFS family arabinose efflux permease
MIVVLTLGHYTAYTYVSPMLLRDGVSASAISVVLAGYGVAGIAGLVLTGTVVDRRPRGALYAAIVLTVACLLGVGLIHDPAGATVTVAAWGFAFGTLPTLIQMVALRAVPRSPDAAPAVVNSAFNVGIAGGALIGARELLLVATPWVLAVTGAALAAASLVALAAVPQPTAASRLGQAEDPSDAGRPADGVMTSR